MFLLFAVIVVVVFGDIVGCKAPGYRAAGSKAASCKVVPDRARPGRARFKLLSCHRGFARGRPAGGHLNHSIPRNMPSAPFGVLGLGLPGVCS